MFNHEFMIRAYTEAAIPRRYSSPFMISDVVANLLFQSGGDQLGSMGIVSTAETDSKTWFDQPHFLKIASTVGFIRLSGKGTPRTGTAAAIPGESPDASKGAGIFFIKPLLRTMNSEMDSQDSNAPKGDSKLELCEWEGAKENSWETRLPDASRYTRVAHSKQISDELLIVRTKRKFEKNRQMRFDLQFWGTVEGSETPVSRITWADNNFAFTWASGASPMLERASIDPATGEPDWVIWHVLEGAPAPNWSGDWTVDINRLNGSIIVTLQSDQYLGRWDFAEIAKSASSQKADLCDIEWNAGRVGFVVRNVNASIAVGLWDYATKTDAVRAGKSITTWKPFKAEFERDAVRPNNMAADKTGVHTILFGRTGGWTKNGTKTSVRMETKPPSFETQYLSVVRYTCTLTASPDGIDTPCVATIYGKYDGEFSNPPSEYLDIRPAALRGSFSSSEPPQAVGNEFRLDISRTLLNAISPDWESYVHAYHPIELLIRKRTENFGQPPTFSPWIGRFKGYQLDSSRECPQVNDWRISLVCESPAKRLQKPHAVIDHKYYPLDLLYAQGDGRRLFVAECVKEILRIALGSHEASRFNGTGDPLRFIELDHPPLISTLGDGAGLFPLSQPIAKSGFTFMPKWNQGPLDWIRELTGFDRTSFVSMLMLDTIANEEAPVEFPSFVCGRYENIISYKEANGGIHPVSDAFYTPGDEDHPISKASSRFKAEFVYNRFLAWANPEGNRHPLLPALLMAEENLFDDDPNSAIHSWERTFVITEDYLYKTAAFGLPLDGVSAAVYLARREFEYKDMRAPTLTFRGNPQIDWGDRIIAKMQNLPDADDFDSASQSDIGLGIANTEYRVLRVDETYEFEHTGPNQYLTTATGGALSSDGY